MSHLNHERLKHRGKPAERFEPEEPDKFTPAKPASPGRSLSREEITRIMSERRQ